MYYAFVNISRIKQHPNQLQRPAGLVRNASRMYNRLSVRSDASVEPTAATAAGADRGDERRRQRAAAAGQHAGADPAHRGRPRRLHAAPAAAGSRAAGRRARTRLRPVLRVQALQGGVPVARAVTSAPGARLLRGPRSRARPHPRRAAGAGVPRVHRRPVPHRGGVQAARGVGGAHARRRAAGRRAATRAAHARDGGRGKPDHAAGGARGAGGRAARRARSRLLRAAGPALPAAWRAAAGQRRPLTITPMKCIVTIFWSPSLSPLSDNAAVHY